MSFYVYHLIDPTTQLPFYIGKGKGQRAWSHLNHRDCEKSYKQNKIDSIRRQGAEPIVQLIKENLTESEAFNLEIAEISKYGRSGLDENGLLTNRTLGGAGGDTSHCFTEDTKQAISYSVSGSKNGQTSLTIDEISDIYLSDLPKTEIAKKHKVSVSCVAAIKRRYTYKSETADLGEPGHDIKSKRKPLTPEKVIEIFTFRGTSSEIQKQFGISVTVARNIKFRNTYRHVTESLGDPGEIVIYSLDWNQVCDIRSSMDKISDLSERYKVDRQTIYNIRSGKTRKNY